ncbi:MAG: hypothetical protein ACFB5Z_10705 [Elainellaceae cyanobacterium]
MVVHGGEVPTILTAAAAGKAGQSLGEGARNFCSRAAAEFWQKFIGYQMMQRERGEYWRSPEAQWRTEPNQP